MIGFLVYGLIIGFIVRAIYPGKQSGLLFTLLIGIAGTYIGGFIGTLLEWSSSLILSIVGGYVACYAYLNRDKLKVLWQNFLNKFSKG